MCGIHGRRPFAVLSPSFWTPIPFARCPGVSRVTQDHGSSTFLHTAALHSGIHTCNIDPGATVSTRLVETALAAERLGIDNIECKSKCEILVGCQDYA